MSALLLAAVHCARVQPSIALAANHLLTIEPGAAAQIPWSKVSSPKSVECHHWAVTLKGCGICIPNPCHPVHTSHVPKNFGSVGDTGGHSQIRARFLAYLLDCLSIIIDHPFLGNYPWLSPKNSWPQRLSRQHRQWGFNDTAAETQHQVEGGLLDRRDGWDPEGSRAPLDEALHGAGRFTNIVLPPNHASLSLSHHVCLMFFCFLSTWSIYGMLRQRDPTTKHINWKLPASPANSSPSGCCNRWEFAHPPAVCQRRSSVAGPEGYLCQTRGQWPTGISFIILP